MTVDCGFPPGTLFGSCTLAHLYYCGKKSQQTNEIADIPAPLRPYERYARHAQPLLALCF